MPLNKNTRIKKILEVKSQQVVGTQKIEWKGEPQWLDVYRVPISYLIYNKYNGRILSRTKSFSQKYY
jgi:rRNA maturation protein Rpf1